MVAMLVSERLDRSWNAQQGLFSIILATAYSRYVEVSSNPNLDREFRAVFAEYLSECWPERFPKLPQDPYRDVIMLDRLPLAEQASLLSAVNLVVRDLKEDRLDPRSGMKPDRREIILRRAEELVDLLEEAIAAATHGVD